MNMTNIKLIGGSKAVVMLLILSLVLSFVAGYPLSAAAIVSEASTIATQAAPKATYAVGEAVPFQVARGAALGTSTIEVSFSGSNGGTFSGGNLSGGCTGSFESFNAVTIGTGSTNKGFCYKATAAGTETITAVFGAEEEILTYEITIVAGTCTDGVQNQDETAVDEGGVCTVTPPPEVCPVGTIGVFPDCEVVVTPPSETTGTVTLCKADDTDMPLAGWTLTLLGEKVEDVTVLANDADGVNTVSNLSAGTSYVAFASGTWNNNRSPLNIVDAEYSTEDTWVTQMDGFTGYGEDILELQINTTGFNSASNWGPYSDSHVYAQSFIQDTTSPAKFHIYDTYYGDNTGELSVTVYEGYAGVTDSKGCVSFTDVPFGNYEVGELQQEGWENISGLGSLTVNTAVTERIVVNTPIKKHWRLGFHQVCRYGNGEGMRLVFGNYNPEAYEVTYTVVGTGETGSFTVAAATETQGALPSRDYKQKQTVFTTNTQTFEGRVDITYFNGTKTDRIIRRAQGRLCDDETVVTPPASLTITAPTVDGAELLPGIYSFMAEYTDDDNTLDTIQWAVRAGTCDPNTNTQAGNVDGFTNASTFVGTNFTATVDMSLWAEGSYCFVVNPLETGGQSDTERAVRTFTLNLPEVVDVCENLEGNQTVIPEGYEKVGESNDCTVIPQPPVDVCKNLEGNQTVIPEGYEKVGESNDCTVIPQPPVDVCKNLEGNQTVIPEGYEKVDESNDCTLIPQTEAPESNQRSSGGGGTRVANRLSTVPQPQVLGASTAQCGMLLTDYMKMGRVNDPVQVKLLQAFLLGQGYATVSVNGVFDLATHEAVKLFQLKYKAEVLTPWLTAGLAYDDMPTGFVYRLTRWKINNIICPGSESAPVLSS
jgi:hypothetical protein